MRRYIVGRLLLMIPTLIGVAILTFVIMRAVPGDIVALRYAGSSVPQEVIDQERHILGLDKPMWGRSWDGWTPSCPSIPGRPRGPDNRASRGGRSGFRCRFNSGCSARWSRSASRTPSAWLG